MDARIKIAALGLFLIASASSAEISGTWGGTAKGVSYLRANGVNTMTKKTLNVTTTISQTGSTLNMTANFSASGGEQFSLTFSGNVGNLTFWGTGAGVAAGALRQNFASGHFDSKASKISGSFVIYANNEVQQYTYKLKKTSAAAPAQRAAMERADAPGTGLTSPFALSGVVTGKNAVLISSDKPAPFKGPLIGDFQPATQKASITITGAGVSTSFSVTPWDGGKGIVFAGKAGSEELLLVGPKGNNQASGTGWIYGSTRVAEFKFRIVETAIPGN